MVSKILVANRGEIALRIIRARASLGIRSAAIYSAADRDAPHVRAADEAHPCGAAPARESYLDIDRVIEIAQTCGADAIHPGYGFLSENASFADACARARIAFVGPPAAVIRAMGDKITSRRSAREAGIPMTCANAWGKPRSRWCAPSVIGARVPASSSSIRTTVSTSSR